MVAFLALVTALWLPWWAVAWDTSDESHVATRDSVSLFRPEPPLTTTWGPWLTGFLVVSAAGLLFVRIAARSDVHEPKTWRRDLAFGVGFVAASLVSASLWPASVPAFWGGRIYTAENVTTQVTETALPQLGWWLAGLALVCLGLAHWGSRPAAVPNDPPA